jgi:hypothetical protein
MLCAKPPLTKSSAIKMTVKQFLIADRYLKSEKESFYKYNPYSIFSFAFFVGTKKEMANIRKLTLPGHN